MEEKDFLTKALTETVLTRRSFLKWSAAVGSATLLANGLTSCAPKVAEAPTGDDGEVLTVGCYHNCGGRCVLYATVKDGTVVRLGSEPTDEDPIYNPRIIPCVRGRDQTRRVYAPDRLKYPMKRVGKRGEGKFEQISWDEALDTIASEMKRIKETYGNEAFYYNYATGAQWAGPDNRPVTRRLLRCFGGYTDYYGDYSAACWYPALKYTVGAGDGNSSDDMLNSKLIVMFGGNFMVTNSGGDNAGYYLLKAKQKGARVISVDPIYHDTAIATEADWIPIYPGTDVALIAAMAYVMVKEDLYDKEFMAKYTVGFDEDTLPEGVPSNSSFMAYIDGRMDGVAKTPQWASEITGISPERIASLAREIAGTKPCMLLQSWGWQRRAYGEQCVRALPILAAMTGNFGLSGGGPGLKHSGMAFKWAGLPLPENPVKAAISVYMWPDFITRGTEMTNGPRDKIRGVEKLNTNLKFMWNGQGNCLINQHSDVNGTSKMLQDESLVEFILVVDVAMTPSAKFADILLPDTTSFEMETLISGEGHGVKGMHAWAMFNHKLVEPLYEAKETYWICDQLAARLGIQEAFREGHETKEDWLRDMVASAQSNYPDFPSLEEFRKAGLYRVYSEKPNVIFVDFVKDPVANPLKTPSGKVEIYSADMAAYNEPEEIPAIPKYIPEWEGVSDPLRSKYPLLMVGHHSVQRSHSTFDDAAFLREVHIQALWINTLDASKRGIKNGDKVRVFNDRGEVHVPAFVTGRLRPGVTSLPQGAWYTPDAKGVDTRGCVNVLTKYHPTPLAKGNPQHTNLVQVEKL